jgi:hypothetical protein
MGIDLFYEIPDSFPDCEIEDYDFASDECFCTSHIGQKIHTHTRNISRAISLAIRILDALSCCLVKFIFEFYAMHEVEKRNKKTQWPCSPFFPSG